MLVEARSLPLPTLVWPLHHTECPDGLDVGVSVAGCAPEPLDAVAARVAALEAFEPVLSVMLANVTHGVLGCRNLSHRTTSTSARVYHFFHLVHSLASSLALA